ncbi:hypothetical protein FACS189465_3130 [Clostridia bacterium]|nr:hypothetical protein FACS189465_3130 [Clostridia bacterium]
MKKFFRRVLLTFLSAGTLSFSVCGNPRPNVLDENGKIEYMFKYDYGKISCNQQVVRRFRIIDGRLRDVIKLHEIESEKLKLYNRKYTDVKVTVESIYGFIQYILNIIFGIEIFTDGMSSLATQHAINMNICNLKTANNFFKKEVFIEENTNHVYRIAVRNNKGIQAMAPFLNYGSYAINNLNDYIIEVE